jgi:hypothetical protein
MAISKSQGYLARVFCVEYDLKGAIEAYGIECVHWLIDEVAAGRIKDIQRWSAHQHLYKFGSTEAPKHTICVIPENTTIQKSPARPSNDKRKAAKITKRARAHA